MAEENETGTPERPVFAKYKGTFHAMDVRPVKAAKGANKIRVLLECEYDVDAAEGLAPLFDKDCSVTFKELASQKRRDRYGGEGGQGLLEGGLEGPEDDIIPE